MEQTMTEYTLGTASLEIIVLLCAAFLLGMGLCGLLRKMGLCCNGTDYAVEEDPYAYTPPQEMPRSGARTPRKFPGDELKSGGYTADINSLLRDPNNTSSRPAAARRPTPVPATVHTPELKTEAEVIPNDEGILQEDLKKLEGIGPRLEKVLNQAGIINFSQLAAASPEQLQEVLADDEQLKMHDPKSWPYQAELADKGEWERLKEYQNLLMSGKV